MMDDAEKKLYRELLSGIINTQLVILQILEREGIVDRDKLIAGLQSALNELGPNLASAPDSMPLRHLIRGLSGASDHPEKGGWTPVVLAGGKSDEDPRES